MMACHMMWHHSGVNILILFAATSMIDVGPGAVLPGVPCAVVPGLLLKDEIGPGVLLKDATSAKGRAFVLTSHKDVGIIFSLPEFFLFLSES